MRSAPDGSDIANILIIISTAVMLLWVLRLCLRGRYCTLWQFWWCYFLSQIYCYVFPSCFRMTDFQYRKHLDHHRHCCYVAMGTSTCACIFIFDKSWSYEKSTGYDSLANSNMNEAAKFIRVKDVTPIALLLCLSWCCTVIKSYKIALCCFSLFKRAHSLSFTFTFNQLTICFVPRVEGSATEA